MRMGSFLKLSVMALAIVLLSQPAQAVVIRGLNTAALIGGDLTDPDNNGQPDANVGYDAIFSSNDEPGFGGGEFSFNVFDNQAGGGNAKWCCGPAGGIPAGGLHITAQLNAGPHFLTTFTLTSANDTPGRDPSVWKIQGSNDGVVFTDIVSHVGTAGLWSARNQVIQFDAGKDFAAPAEAYSHYRFVTLNTQLNPAGAYFQIAEIEYFGSTTAQAATEFVNLNIASAFNADVIVGSVGGVLDATQDGIDGGNRNYLTQAAAAQIGGANGTGVPNDGAFSFLGNQVQLGWNNNDNGNNAIRLTGGGSASLTLDPGQQGAYQSMFLFATNGDGDSAMQVTLNYADGTSQVLNLVVDDWFNDDAELSAGVFDLIDGLDRTNGGGNGFENNNDPAIFAINLGIDGSKVLTGINLQKTGGGVTSIFGLGGQRLQAVPEPASAFLGLIGLGALALRRRRLN